MKINNMLTIYLQYNTKMNTFDGFFFLTSIYELSKYQMQICLVSEAI